MALFIDQQQQQEPETQLQPYGVSSGTRVRSRVVQHVPYVPVNMNIGQHFFRARQLPVHPAREQHHAMLQDRVNQDMLQHNIQQQDNIAYNPRPYDDQQGLIGQWKHAFSRVRTLQIVVRARPNPPVLPGSDDFQEVLAYLVLVQGPKWIVPAPVPLQIPLVQPLESS